MNNLTATQLKVLNNLSKVRDVNVLLGTIIQSLITEGSSALAAPEGGPVNAVNATGVLNVTGVVIHGETVTINNPAVAGSDVYEFLATAAQTPSSPTNKAVNINASSGKAAVVLTVDTKPTAGDTFTLGSKTYIFVPVGTANADGEISIGADVAAAKLNIVAAINGTDGINTAHTLVTAAAFVADACTITAIIGGTAGNSIASTETFTAGTNVFAATTLLLGTNCTAANAITALVASITANDTQGVGAADGTGDTIDLSADVAGTIGNAITLAETMANGAFGAGTLASGVNGTVALKGTIMVDATYLYVPIADNTTAGKNWRRIAVGSAY